MNNEYLLNTPDLQNYGKQDNLISQSCLNQNFTKDECESLKPIKYWTTSFTELDPDNLGSLSRGINFNDGFGISGDNIEISSKLRNAGGNGERALRSMTTPLPTTAGFYRGHGNIEAENSLRPINDKTRNACNPRENHYYNRTMAIFNDIIPSPYSNIDDYFIPNDKQYGIDSRGDSVKKYNRSYTNKVEENCAEFN